VWHSHTVISNSVKLKSQLVMHFKINTAASYTWNQSINPPINAKYILIPQTNSANTCSEKTAQPEQELLRQFKKNEMVPRNTQLTFTEMFNLNFMICTDYGDSECRCEQTKW